MVVGRTRNSNCGDLTDLIAGTKFVQTKITKHSWTEADRNPKPDFHFFQDSYWALQVTLFFLSNIKINLHSRSTIEYQVRLFCKKVFEVYFILKTKTDGFGLPKIECKIYAYVSLLQRSLSGQPHFPHSTPVARVRFITENLGMQKRRRMLRWTTLGVVNPSGQAALVIWY